MKTVNDSSLCYTYLLFQNDVTFLNLINDCFLLARIHVCQLFVNMHEEILYRTQKRTLTVPGKLI